MTDDGFDDPVIVLHWRSRARLALDLAFIRFTYWIRPFDMLNDHRRWRWQRRTPCGRQVWANLPPAVRDALTAAIPRPHRSGCIAPKNHKGECWP